MRDAVARAEKKLRQAEFFVAHLEDLSKQPNYRSPANPEHLEFFFSASLTAARSVYSVLNHSGHGAFQKIRSKWYENLNEQRSFFDKMKNLRDGDVHHASTAAEPLQKYVKADVGRRESPNYQSAIYSPVLFGPHPTIEAQNPDGETVRGHALSGTIGLYIKEEGKYVAASTACRQFIRLLRSLLDAVKDKTQSPLMTTFGRVLKRGSGHKTRSMFDRYNIVDESDFRAAQVAVGKRYEKLTS